MDLYVSMVCSPRVVIIGPVRGYERCFVGARIQKLNYNRYLRLSRAEDLLCASNARLVIYWLLMRSVVFSVRGGAVYVWRRKLPAVHAESLGCRVL